MLMLVTRTRQVTLKGNHFSYWCHKAKNVYNKSNYIVRQEYVGVGRYIPHYELYHLVKHDGEYRELPSLVANEVLRCLHQAWIGFFAAMRSYEKDPSRFVGRPRIPGYKDRNSEMTIAFPRKHLALRKSFLFLPKKVGRTKIRHELPENTSISMVRIVPTGAGYSAEVIFQKEIDYVGSDAEGPVVGIDLRVENIITVTDSCGNSSWIVKGGVVKSTNQFYNKIIARLRSICIKAGIMTTRRIRKLTVKRNRIRICLAHRKKGIQ